MDNLSPVQRRRHYRTGSPYNSPCRLKDFNPDGLKISWTNEVIILALNKKNYMIDNEDVTTDICKKRITHFKLMNEEGREHWLATVSENESKSTQSGFTAKIRNRILTHIETR